MQQRALTVILCLWIWPLSLQAACSGTGSARNAVELAIFFVGWVISITDQQAVDEIGNDSSKQLRVHLAVLERFPAFDSPVQEADVLTAARGHGFGYPFVIGSAYLVFAERKKEGLVTSICHGTKLLSEAGEDLAYLRSVPRLRQRGELNGVIECKYTAYKAWTWVPSWMYALVRQLLPPDLERRFLPGMSLRLDGGGTSHFTVTDGNGGFHFLNLLPGIYTLHLEQKGLDLLYGGPIRVVPGSGRTLRFHADAPRIVEGTVKTVAGVVAQNVQMDLAQISERHVYWHYGGITDEHGRFEMNNLVPGVYYVGVSVGLPPSLKHPYNTWYYPGTPDLTRAVTIRFGSQPETQKINFTLPPALSSDVIRVLVFAPDRQPVRDADVHVRDIQSGGESILRCCAATKGTIAFRAFEKRSYRIVAFASLGTETWMTKPLIINFEASTPRTLKLILSEHGEQKRQKAIEHLGPVY